MKHAVLSPSSAHRWLNCTPSARLAEKYPDTESEHAKEGTLAHSLGELLLQAALGLITREKYKSDFAAIKSNPLYDKNMLSYCKDYRDYVLEVYNGLCANNAGETVIELEVKTDLSRYAPQSFGSVDCRIYNDNDIHIIDFKYGKGVRVEVFGFEPFG